VNPWVVAHQALMLANKYPFFITLCQLYVMRTGKWLSYLDLYHLCFMFGLLEGGLQYGVRAKVLGLIPSEHTLIPPRVIIFTYFAIRWVHNEDRDSHVGGRILDHSVRGHLPLSYHLCFLAWLLNNYFVLSWRCF
jgi:hypothetical protein